MSLIVRLHGMDEGEVRAYARTLPRALEDRCSREVYYLDGVAGVLKLASPHRLSRYTYDQNVSEVVLWDLLSPAYRRHFAAILAHSDDGLWLVQEKVDPLWGDVPEELVLVAEEVGIAELWPWNCGTRPSTGQVVILDYGISKVWECITGETPLDLISEWRTTYLSPA